MDSEVSFDALGLLRNYEGNIEGMKIDFIARKDADRIRPALKELIEQFEIATDTLSEERSAWQKKLEEASDRKEFLRRHKKPVLSRFLDWNEVHRAGQKLWNELMSAALRDIDPNSKGNSKLFKFLDVSAEFEDLLYGLERYYRDHTLHSLWVYLIGVKLMGTGGVFHEIGTQLNWFLFNDIEQGTGRYPYPDVLVEWAQFREWCFCMELERRRDAIWCIMALCHDLGYSLEKLTKLNDKVIKVLGFFHVADFKHVGYSLEIEHQYLVSQFLDLMAMDVRIVPGEGYKELGEAQDDDQKEHDQEERKQQDNQTRHDAELIAMLPKVKEEVRKVLGQRQTSKLKLWETFKKAVLEKHKDHVKPLEDRAKDIEEQTLVKCYRDDSTYWRLCKALERKEHGILSAYLLYKTLGMFADTSVRGAAEEWGLEDQEVIYDVIRGDILFAIAQHEFAYAHLDQLGSLAEILILCDELEEFTRLGRQLQSREYHDTAAETSIRIATVPEEKNGDEDVTVNGKWIGVEMHYKSEHATYDDFQEFFWRKSKRLCTVYSLGQERNENESVYNPIDYITAHFEWQPQTDTEENELVFTMNRDSDHHAKLGKSVLSCDKAEEEYCTSCPVRCHVAGQECQVRCVDDEICMATKCSKNVTLREWLGLPTDE